MPVPPQMFRGEFWENQTVHPMARVVGADGSLVTQADITAIALNVYDVGGSTPDTAIHTDAPTSASTIYDTLQTDGYWDSDDLGYNFRDSVDTSAFSGTTDPDGGRQYRFSYQLTSTSWGTIWLVYELTARSIVPI